MTTKKSTTKSTKTAKSADRIDILDAALTTHGGDPKDATLFGIDFKIRRDFTAKEVTDYISLFTIKEDETPSIAEQIDAQLAALTDLDDKNRAELTEKLLDQPIAVITPTLIQIGKVAGLRNQTGNFTPGLGF